jgi:uncharacterized membrane protein
MSTMLDSLPALACVGACIVAGVFLAFSSFVTRALREWPACHGVAAMQRVNVGVLNPGFLAVFVGTAVLAGVCVLAAGFFPWGAPRSKLLLLAGLSCLVGAFSVTAMFNVPRDQRLARMEAESAEAAACWPVYVREWLRWNPVRTAAATLCAACAAGAWAS